MPENDSLQQLIRSMTPSEKRYFKRFASGIQEGEKHYLLVFEDLDSDRKKRKKAPYADNLAYTRNYLRTMVLRSLEQFHSRANISNEIHSLLKQVEILFDKSLYDQAVKQLKKARKLAIRYWHFSHWQQTLVWELRLSLSPKYRGEMNRDRKAIFEEEQAILKDQLIISQARQLRFASQEDAFSSMLRELNELKQEATTDYARLEVARSQLELCRRGGKVNEALAFGEEELAIWLKHDHLTRDRIWSSKYINLLAFLSQLYLEVENLEACGRTIERLKEACESDEALKRSAHLELRLWVQYYKVKFDLFLQQNQITEGYHLAMEVLTTNRFSFEQLNAEFRLPLGVQMARACFLAGEYRTALYRINDVLNDKFLKDLPDLNSSAIWLNRLIHYELGNQDHLDYLFQRSGPVGKENDLIRLLFCQFSTLHRPKDKIRVAKAMAKEMGTEKHWKLSGFENWVNVLLAS